MGNVHQIPDVHSPHTMVAGKTSGHVSDYQIMFPVTGFPIWNYVAIGYNFLALPLYGQVRIL